MPNWHVVPAPPVTTWNNGWVAGRAPIGCITRALAAPDGRARWICSFVVTVEVDLPGGAFVPPGSSLPVPWGVGVWATPFDPAAAPGWAFGAPVAAPISR